MVAAEAGRSAGEYTGRDVEPMAEADYLKMITGFFEAAGKTSSEAQKNFQQMAAGFAASL